MALGKLKLSNFSESKEYEEKASSDKCLVLCRSLGQILAKVRYVLSREQRLSSHDATYYATHFSGIEQMGKPKC